MRLLLGSGGLRTVSRQQVYFNEMRSIFEDCKEVVFIPYASNNHESYTTRLAEFSEPSGVKLRSIDDFNNPVDAIMQAEGLYVGGGNTFLLAKKLHDNGLIDIVRKRVVNGMPYMGVSAGSNVACPTMQTTNDMPIVQPQSFNSLDIVPFQINPHYYPGKIRFMDGDSIEEHFGETRNRRIEEFHRHYETPVLGMWEGSFISWDGMRCRLFGRATSFLPGEEPREIEDGEEFNGNLEKITPQSLK